VGRVRLLMTPGTWNLWSDLGGFEILPILALAALGTREIVGSVRFGGALAFFGVVVHCPSLD